MGKLPDLIIGDLKINPPIIQGGMGVRISLAKLASAVANEGAIGTIATALIGGIKSHFSMDEYALAQSGKDAAQMTEIINAIKELFLVHSPEEIPEEIPALSPVEKTFTKVLGRNLSEIEKYILNHPVYAKDVADTVYCLNHLNNKNRKELERWIRTTFFKDLISRNGVMTN